MAGTDVEIEVANIKLETRRLLQSSVAILEKVQALTRIQPTSWDQLKMMLETTAEYDDWDEKIQNWLMNVKSSLAALGINTNFQYKVTTKKWIDVTTGQEFVATPIMQALAESIQSEITQRFWFGPTKVLMSTTKCDRLVCQSCLEEVKEGYWDWLSSLVSHLLDAADHKTTW